MTAPIITLTPLLPVVLLFAACQPVAPGSFDPIPTKKIEERADVSPSGQRVAAGARESSRQGKAVDANVDALKRQVDMAVTAEERTRSVLDGLIDKQSATVEELENVRFLLGDVSKMNLGLRLQVEDLKELTTSLTQQLDTQEDATAHLQAELLLKDKEVKDLRFNEEIQKANVATLVTDRDAWEKKAKADADAAAKEKERADNLAGEIRIWRIAAIAVAVVVGLYLFVRFLLPWIMRAVRGGV